ncbi:MAG: outer membrane protein transport protein [bacterium]
MKRIVLMLVLGLVGIFIATEAMATRGAMPHAYGTRATGLGSAFDAISDDAISPAVYNPAGLTQIRDMRFDMDMIFLRPYLSFNNKDVNPQNGQNGRATSAGFIPEDYLLLNNNSGGRTAKNNYFIMGGMGLAMRIGEKTVFGAGFVGRAGGGSNYRMKQSPFSFVLPYDANDTPSNRADDFLVPLAQTRRGTITGQPTANLPMTDSQQLTTPSDQAYFVTTEYTTDLKIPEFGPAIGYEVNDYLSVGVSARVVGGAFRFRQGVGTGSEIMKGTGTFNNGQKLGASAPAEVIALGLNNYGGVLSGKFKDPNLGGVQFGYQEVQGYGQLENAYAGGFGWGTGIHYRPFGSNKLVLSASYKSRAVMDFKGGELMFDFSDQFRKFYYDTAQFGEFVSSTFGTSYLTNGTQTLRGPKFFNALLGTIDYPASQGDVLAQKAMEWFFNGTNKDGTPTLVRDANNYVRYINLTAFYDPYMQFAMPRELAFGAAWRPTERLLLSLEYRQIYMNDMVGDNFTLNLRSGSSPFFDWLLGVEEGGQFDFSMYTDFNTIRSISLGAEYDLGDKWTIRAGVQHSNNTFTANHIPFTFNMQPEDEFSAGFGYKLSDHWLLDFAASTAFTLDTTESKGTEKSDPATYVDGNGDGYIDLSPGSTSGDSYSKGSEIDQFHSNAEFDHKQWQVNFGIAYVW